VSTVFYEIERGIELPNRSERGKLKRALEKLWVGESVKIPASQRNSVGGVAKQLGIKCGTEKIGEDVVRVWRIS
jgi:hypothetical protein